MSEYSSLHSCTVSSLVQTGTNEFTVDINKATFDIEKFSTDSPKLTHIQVTYKGRKMDIFHDAESGSLYDSSESVALLDTSENKQQSGGAFRFGGGKESNIFVAWLKNKSKKLRKSKRNILMMLMLLAASTVMKNSSTPQTTDSQFTDSQFTPLPVNMILVDPQAHLLNPIVETSTLCTFMSNLSKLDNLVCGIKDASTLQNTLQVPSFIQPLVDDLKHNQDIPIEPPAPMTLNLPNTMCTLDNEIVAEYPPLQAFVNQSSLMCQTVFTSILEGEVPPVNFQNVKDVEYVLDNYRKDMLQNLDSATKNVYEKAAENMDSYFTPLETASDAIYHASKYVYLNSGIIVDAVKASHNTGYALTKSTASAIMQTASLSVKTIQDISSLVQHAGESTAFKVIVDPLLSDKISTTEHALEILETVSELSQKFLDIGKGIYWSVANATLAIDTNIPSNKLAQLLEKKSKTISFDLFNLNDVTKSLVADTYVEPAFKNLTEKLFAYDEGRSHSVIIPFSKTELTKSMTLSEKDTPISTLTVLSASTEFVQTTSPVSVVPLSVTTDDTSATFTTPSTAITVVSVPIPVENIPHSMNFATDPISPLNNPNEESTENVASAQIHDQVQIDEDLAIKVVQNQNENLVIDPIAVNPKDVPVATSFIGSMTGKLQKMLRKGTEKREREIAEKGKWKYFIDLVARNAINVASAVPVELIEIIINPQPTSKIISQGVVALAKAQSEKTKEKVLS